MARSIVNQNLYLQAEATPGTAATDAMRRYLGIKGNIGWDTQTETFKAAGSKVDTAEVVTSELGTISLEAIQDYNSFLPLLSGVFGKPVTTPVSGSTGAYEHVFTLDAFAADALSTYTAIWGDPTQALMATYLAFHGMTLGVQRNQLNLTTTGILRAPTTGASIPGTVEDVPMTPIRASNYCAYLDASWDDLGTTKLLNLYNTSLTFGDKYSADWLVDCALDSFSTLIENDDIQFSQSMTLGFDATAVAQIEDAQEGGLKFVRVEAEGPEIEGSGENYKITIDTAVSLTPQSTGRSPVSPAVVVEFNGRIMVDPATGNTARVTLVNGLDSI